MGLLRYILHICAVMVFSTLNTHMAFAANTYNLIQDCNVSLASTDCKTRVADALKYIEWTDAHGHRFDVTAGLFYHTDLYGKGIAILDQNLVEVIQDNPEAQTLGALSEDIHTLNKGGWTSGYFRQADDLQAQGVLLDEYYGWNDDNDPLRRVPHSNPRAMNLTVLTNHRLEIEEKLFAYDVKDFFVPRTLGGVVVEIGTTATGVKFLKLGGQGVIRIGKNIVKSTDNGQTIVKTVTRAPNRGFHSSGYRSDFYDAGGNPTKWMNPLTGKIEDIPSGVSFHKDHVFPKNEIRNLEGFDQLSGSQKNQILNDPSNFQPLNGFMNCSKGCTINGTANQWDTYKGQPVNPEYGKWLQQQQNLSRQSLQAKIDAMLQ